MRSSNAEKKSKKVQILLENQALRVLAAANFSHRSAEFSTFLEKLKDQVTHEFMFHNGESSSALLAKRVASKQLKGAKHLMWRARIGRDFRVVFAARRDVNAKWHVVVEEILDAHQYHKLPEYIFEHAGSEQYWETITANANVTDEAHINTDLTPDSYQDWLQNMGFSAHTETVMLTVFDVEQVKALQRKHEPYRHISGCAGSGKTLVVIEEIVDDILFHIEEYKRSKANYESAQSAYKQQRINYVVQSNQYEADLIRLKDHPAEIAKLQAPSRPSHEQPILNLPTFTPITYIAGTAILVNEVRQKVLARLESIPQFRDFVRTTNFVIHNHVRFMTDNEHLLRKCYALINAGKSILDSFVQEYININFDLFCNWLNALPLAVKKEFKTAQQHLYAEFKLLGGINPTNKDCFADISLQEYLALSENKTHFAGEERKKVYQLFLEYEKAFGIQNKNAAPIIPKQYDETLLARFYLQQMKKLNNTQDAQKQQHKIRIDEAQNLAEMVLLANIEEYAYVTLLSDSRQITDKRILDTIDMEVIAARHQQGMLQPNRLIRLIKLLYSYRSRAEIKSVVDHFDWLIKASYGAAKEKTVDEEMFISLKTDVENPCFHVVNHNTLLLDIIKKNAVKTGKVIIAVADEQQKVYVAKLLRDHKGDGYEFIQFYTVDELEGLETQTVVLWNLPQLLLDKKELADINARFDAVSRDPETAIVGRSKDKSVNNPDRDKASHLQKIRLAISRATDNVILVQDQINVKAQKEINALYEQLIGKHKTLDLQREEDMTLFFVENKSEDFRKLAEEYALLARVAKTEEEKSKFLAASAQMQAQVAQDVTQVEEIALENNKEKILSDVDHKKAEREKAKQDRKEKKLAIKAQKQEKEQERQEQLQKAIVLKDKKALLNQQLISIINLTKELQEKPQQPAVIAKLEESIYQSKEFDDLIYVAKKIKEAQLALVSLFFLQIANGNIKFVKFMLEREFSVHSQYQNEVALHTAIRFQSKNFKEMIALLLAHGAKPDIYDCIGHTALTYALTANNLEVAQMLEQAGADITLPTKSGTTPTHCAIAIGGKETLTWLTNHEKNRHRRETIFHELLTGSVDLLKYAFMELFPLHTINSRTRQQFLINALLSAQFDMYCYALALFLLPTRNEQNMVDIKSHPEERDHLSGLVQTAFGGFAAQNSDHIKLIRSLLNGIDLSDPRGQIFLRPFKTAWDSMIALERREKRKAEIIANLAAVNAAPSSPLVSQSVFAQNASALPSQSFSSTMSVQSAPEKTNSKTL